MSYRPVQVDLPDACLKHSPAAVWGGCLFAFLGLVSSTVINYSPYNLAWDEAYYLHRAICMNHAVYDLSLARITECLAGTHKGPIIELVDLPWGRTGGTDWGMGLAFVGLALFIWIMVLATYLTCLRGRIPPTSLLLGAGCICLTPLLRESGGALMTDMLLAWCIALALMLIPLEYNEPQTEWWPSIFRGFLWGIVIDVGMLSKVTFGLFAGAIGLALVAIRWRRSGIPPLLCAISGCLAGAAPAILIWLIYGRTFLRFAMLAAWGFGDLYSVPGMTAVGYWRRYFSELRWALIPLLILFALFIRGLLIEKQGRLVRLVPIGIALIYLATASASQNREPRFTVPVMIAMPLCLAWTNLRSASQATMRPAPLLAVLLVVTLFAIPMVGKPNIVPIEHAGELLKTLSQGRSTTVILATDGPLFNVDTFQLARQIGGNTLRPVLLDTLVYDEVNKRSLEDGLRRIDKADYVLFLKPGNSPGPDWTMTRAKDYRTYCENVGKLMAGQISPDFDVFKIH